MRALSANFDENWRLLPPMTPPSTRFGKEADNLKATFMEGVADYRYTWQQIRHNTAEVQVGI